jgi:protein-tyrosine phosphatase
LHGGNGIEAETKGALKEVLFVCTGNVFRSLAAEYALRRLRPDLAVASAGTSKRDEVVPPEIAGYLLTKGVDVRAHRRRTLTREILERAHVAVAMSTDHRDFIRANFGRSVPLFLECCGDAPEGLLDLHEAISDFRTDRVAALSYLQRTIDRIVDGMPRLARRIDLLLNRPS